MPRKIDWSKNESNVKLLVATYAVLGKDTFSRCFADIAKVFGDDATYDSINHRFRTIADKAEQLQDGVENFPRPAVSRRARPVLPRKRRRGDDNRALEPDDLLAIEEVRRFMPDGPLRDASSRGQRARGTSHTSPSLCGNIQEVFHNGEVHAEGHIRYPVAEQSTRAFAARPSVEPMPGLFEAAMGARAEETLEARMARSSQEHAEQRAQSRRMYMEAHSNHRVNGFLNVLQQSRPDEPLYGRSQAAFTAKNASYIDPIKKKCVLCNKKWHEVAQAREHEALSELHRSNLLQPELVQAADRKLIGKEQVEQPPSHRHGCMPGETNGVVDLRAESGPTNGISAPIIPISATPSPPPRTRESSVIIVDPPAHRGRGKERAAPIPPTPARVRHRKFTKQMRRFSARGRKSLPKYKVALEVMDDLIRELEREYGRESSSSLYVDSACDDSQDEDYLA